MSYRLNSLNRAFLGIIQGTVIRVVKIYGIIEGIVLGVIKGILGC